MGYTIFTFLITLGLFLGMLLLLDLGRRVGIRRRAQDPDGAGAGTGAVDGAVFALLGLLIAFTFSGAASRFDTRRDLIVEEANDIGTAYLRINLLPASAQAELRESFRRYVDARLEGYRKLPDIEAAKVDLAKATQLQNEIWNQAIAAGRLEGAQPAATMLLLPALNQMFDITTTRTMTTQMHPPKIIFAMLFVLTLASSLLAGYGMAGGKSRNWIHMGGFALIMAFAIYVILDLEYPRIGLIRVDAFDQVIMDVRAGMK
ncbi:MAG: DUF4239 domain-containing protein [Candidatus Competibacteraceae bacterium]|nr:DUF4239 domain-containing protein [Candidatus Competibacteraceae bacterium]